MKKTLLITSMLVIAALALKAQQLPMYSQYMFNGFLLNPAEAGTDPHFPIRLTVRQQWLGIDGAPLTFALSGHTLFSSRKVGAGGYIFRDQFGPVARTGILGAYAYHLDLPVIKSKLAMGISLTVFQYQLKMSDLTVINTEDPAMSKTNESAIVPDANFGARLYNDKYFVGLAATQLIEFKMKLGDYATKETKMVRHYFLTGGYLFVLSKMIHLEPSLLLKGTERTPFNIDVNVRCIYDEKYWAGLSFRSDKDLICLLGIKTGIFYFGYAFDWPFSPLNSYAYGSHEIMIGVDLSDDTGGSTLF
ncbi:MAG: type IX secretion system membrane protein PorP/SprF [Bacteroidia bacterium]|nr:type IX secretion system membrane protein PorP/SprF [Bacteroidia bacterium]